MTWSPGQYLVFEDERTRPVRDLVAAIPDTHARSVVDIGCGPGNSTEVLAERFPGAEITGLDSSPEMIAAARLRLPHCRFDLVDIAAWSPAAPPDVVLANAVLQWLPDHATLLPRLVGMLAPGGSLAVQMPDNLGEPSHRLMCDVAMQGPWADRLASAAAARTLMESATWFYRLVRPHCARVDVWRTTYHHALEGGPGAVVEWFKGSGLRPFLAPLDQPERTEFLHRYRTLLTEAYPAMPDGAVLLPFPRLFIVATR